MKDLKSKTSCKTENIQTKSYAFPKHVGYSGEVPLKLAVSVFYANYNDCHNHKNVLVQHTFCYWFHLATCKHLQQPCECTSSQTNVWSRIQMRQNNTEQITTCYVAVSTIKASIMRVRGTSVVIGAFQNFYRHKRNAVCLTAWVTSKLMLPTMLC